MPIRERRQVPGCDRATSFGTAIVVLAALDNALRLTDRTGRPSSPAYAEEPSASVHLSQVTSLGVL